MTREKQIILVQPYLSMKAKDYRGMFAGHTDVLGFYEFSVKDGWPGHFQAVPDGSTDLVFGIGSRDVKTYIGGTVLKAKGWEFEEGRTYFGIRFRPGKCILPKDLSIKDVVDADLELSPYAYGSTFLEQIAGMHTLEQKADLFLQHFSKQEQRENGTIRNIETYVRKRIYESGGNISIAELTEETGYSESYLRRAFGQIHGISPKVFEGFVRFQRFLKEISVAGTCMSTEEAALACGYYDQSHMMKDFKRFAGMTPEQHKKLILNSRRPVWDYQRLKSLQECQN